MEHRFEEFNGGALSGGCYRRGTEEVQTGSLDMRRNQRGWPQAPVELDQDWQLGSKIQSQQALRNWKHTKFVLLPQSIYAKKKKKKPTKRLINILLSCVQIFAIPWTVACQALLSMDFPGKNTGVGCHSLLQGIFPTQDWTWVSCLAGAYSLPPEKTLITILPQLITILPRITIETIKYLNRRLKKMLYIKIFGMQLVSVEGIL